MADKQPEKTEPKAGAAKDAPKDAAKDAAKGAKPAAAGKKISKKLIVIAAGALLLAGGGGAAAYLLLGQPHESGAPADKKAEPKKIPVFVDLETFTVNLREPDDDRFLQLKLVAELKDAPSGEVLKTMMPAVRSEILLLLGSKLVQDISSRAGKETLAREIVLAANKPLAGTPAEQSIEAVNFTHLIIQ